MSRLIITSLPPSITSSSLKTHLTQSSGPGGTITDVKIPRTPRGQSRCFAFVGYRTEEEAGRAKEWFNGTFVGGRKVGVEVIDGTKDPPTPRPNKRRKLDTPSQDVKRPISSSSDAKSKSELKKSKQDTKGKADQLEEFMQVMRPRTKKGPSWANDVGVVVPGPHQTTTERVDERVDDQEDVISDLDWMKRHMKGNLDEKEFEQDEEPTPNIPEEVEIPQDPTRTTILQTSRLFLRNLTFSCTEDDLMELFKPFGEVSQVHIPLDPISKATKGLAYVTFAQPTSALAAYEKLDGRSFQGRLLHVLPAVDRKGKFTVEEGEGRKKSVKGAREGEKKKMAGKGFNWAMLYMNSDAVASSVADRMNIPKSEILNPESDNAAVKLALAETHIIQETKAYLSTHGVSLSSFSTTSRHRSDTIILVKNIPYGTTGEQIREIFEVHGELNRVLVPPAGTMAIVEFERGDEAEKAFKAVAYRRLGNSVVYLEKGPIGMFDGDEKSEEGKVASAVTPVTIPEQKREGREGEEEPGIAEGSTLFVKNLSFATTGDRLTQVLQHLPSFAFARVQMKPDPQRPGAKLSMGYGFVGFKNLDGAKTAMKSLNGFVLDGHSLHVKFAGRGRDEDENKDKAKLKSKTTKMVVKNVPFEATKKDIRELFSSHGQLKSVRLPKKFDSRSRGFAFLEFITRQEAENAYSALRHTHLLGRHLVLEWAEEGEQDLDLLRKKAGVGFGGGAELPGRKRKLELGNDAQEVDNEGL